ncbi:MAG: SDR family oxidoreductase [Sporichthyaceae bacterium]
MSESVLVTGGNSILGRKLVRTLITAGRDVRVLSRRDRPGVEPGTPKLPDWPDWFVGDLATGAGLGAALDGVGVVVHCATVPRGEVEAAAHLQIAATRAAKPHIVYPSVVGADRIEHPYYRDKRAVERLLEAGELPWTVLRMTHFHESVQAGMRRRVRGVPVIVGSGERFQPVAADEAAARLADMCSPMQAHLLPDLGGPEVATAVELAMTWLAATGRRRRIVAIKMAGKLHQAHRAGLHLTTPERAVGNLTFAQYLAAAHPPLPSPKSKPKARSRSKKADAAS